MRRPSVVLFLALVVLASVSACNLRVPAKRSIHLSKPVVGECHLLTFQDIAAPSDTKKPVACSSRHTTMTVAVVARPKAVDHGKPDAEAFAVGRACGAGFIKAVGGTSKSRANTLYSLAWFTPTKAQRAKGARWMRCDVTLTDEARAYPIRGKQPFLRDGASSRERRCGRITGNRKSLSWHFVPCSQSHQLYAKKLVAAAPDAKVEGSRRAAKKACKNGLYTWTGAEQWGVGDRWYVCWGAIKRPADTLET